MRSTEKNYYRKRNASTLVKHHKLQPILEPGNTEKIQNILRVFVHFVIPDVPVKCHKIITFVSYALLSRVPLLSSMQFNFRRRYSTMPARSFVVARAF